MKKELVVSLPPVLGACAAIAVFLGDYFKVQNFNRVSGFAGVHFLDPLIYSLFDWRGVFLAAIVWGSGVFLISAFLMLPFIFFQRGADKTKG